MCCLIRLCVSSLQPTCPNTQVLGRDPGSHWAVKREWMFWAFASLYKHFPASGKLLWKPPAAWLGAGDILQHLGTIPKSLPAYTCIELHLQPVCCEKQCVPPIQGWDWESITTDQDGKFPSQSGLWDLQGWLMVWNTHRSSVLTSLWAITSTRRVWNALLVWYSHAGKENSPQPPTDRLPRLGINHSGSTGSPKWVAKGLVWTAALSHRRVLCGHPYPGQCCLVFHSAFILFSYHLTVICFVLSLVLLCLGHSNPSLH